MVPAEVVLLDTAELATAEVVPRDTPELAVAAVDVDGEIDGRTLVVEPGGLKGVLAVIPDCALQVSTADNDGAADAKGVEGGAKVVKGELNAISVDSVGAGAVEELSGDGNGGLDGGPDGGPNDCSVGVVEAVPSEDSAIELGEEGLEVTAGAFGGELAGGSAINAEAMLLMRMSGAGEAIVVVTRGELERGTAGSVELEPVVFPS